MSYAANLEESCSPSLNYKSSYLFPEYNDETVIKTIILFQSEILEEKKRGGVAHGLQISAKPAGQIPPGFKMTLLDSFR